MGKRTLLASVLLLFSCGSQPLDPNDFEIAGNWGGDLILGVSVFPIGITLTPEEDGAIELYEADGNFFTSFQNSRINGRVEYNTATGEISIEFPLFPVPTTAMIGTVEGTTMNVTEDVVCFCSLSLVRDAAPVTP